MITPENPPGFVVRTEAQKAAWDNGFRLEQDIEHGWVHYCALYLDNCARIGVDSRRVAARPMVALD
jgi:hypothetical protein